MVKLKVPYSKQGMILEIPDERFLGVLEFKIG